MHRIRTFALTVVVALVAAVAPAAAQTRAVITFAQFRSDTSAEYQATRGGDVTSQGMDFYAVSRNALGTWGTDPAQDPYTAPNVPTNLGPSAAALFGTQFGERIDMERSDHGAFQIQSIDLAHAYARESLLGGDVAPISLYFYGFYANGTSVTTSFTIPVPPLVGSLRPPELRTYAFGSAWSNLVELSWFQGSGAYDSTIGGPPNTGSIYSHQFTNVVVSLAPEPGTYCLLSVGLVGVLVATRRRRREG